MAKTELARKMVVRTLVWLMTMGLLLLGSAGTLAWPQAWVFLLLMAGPGFIMGFWLLERDPGLLEQRMSVRFQRGQPTWDRVFLALFLGLWVVWLIVMGLDAVRFHASHVPIWLECVGAVGILTAMGVITLVFRANSFAAPVVKIQQDRGHAIVTTGPYRYVRHPMYAGAIFFMLGTPLLLGSWYGVGLAFVFIIGLALRAVMEERTLAAQFATYAEYAARVRYRLIPLVW